jgi:tRNA dimethylallyltransferase
MAASGELTVPDAGPICPVICGPTAVGKTALILDLAAHNELEVISLDSRQIYRGMRIGTAQPTAAERAACAHHLVDFVSPRRKYSAARFRRDFNAAYRDIRARGKLPLLVGGAGLYLQAVQEGLFDLDEQAVATTAEARAELARLSDDEIRSRLRAVDPASWERIHPNDRYRSQRALEIEMVTGQTITELLRQQRRSPALGLAFPVVYLKRPTSELAKRIAVRTDSMLAAGWMEETASLLDEHGPEAPGLSCLGYREIVAHLQGELAREVLNERIVSVTRQYAKRQRTWFRSIPRVMEGLPEDPSLRHVIANLLARAALTVDAPGAPNHDR